MSAEIIRKLEEELTKLEITSRALEPDAAARAALRDQVVQYSELFLNHAGTVPAFVVTDDLGAGILQEMPGESGADIGSILDSVREHIDKPGLNPASGGHLGYIPGGGIYASALGDYLADIFNRYAGVFYASPGAVRLENMMVRWMNKLIGFPEDALGTLTSGGSIANLTAIVTARDAKGVDSSNVRKAVIYLSKQAHHSIDKAVRISGTGECSYRFIELDEGYRIDPQALEEQVLKDLEAGLFPWMVIAAAGTTDAGAVDPLDQIAAIAKKHNLWFHIDAAYGGFFMLTAEGREKMRGIGQADSVTLDPHKGLFLPYGTGAVLIRDVKAMAHAHRYTASYLQDISSVSGEISPADVSPELTRHFRALRMWLPLKLHGIAAFRACLEEKLVLAKYAREKLKAAGFVVGPEPDLSVVMYRWPGGADVNQRLLEHVKRDGRVFISSTTIGGEYWLRFAILAFRTHKETIDTAMAVLEEGVIRSS